MGAYNHDRKRGHMVDGVSTEQQPRYVQSSGGNNGFVNFVTFHAMVTPIILQVIFWLAEIGNVVFWINRMSFRRLEYNGGYSFHYSHPYFWWGLLGLLVGIVLIRVYVELLIVTFKINENVFRIRKHFDATSVGFIPSGQNALPNAGVALRPSASIYCPQCGSQTGGAKFCMECGRDMSGAGDAPTEVRPSDDLTT